MTTLKLYYIDKDYINYLKDIDYRVQNNYDDNKNRNKKPYVGTLFVLNDKLYFAPLTSPKEKHTRWNIFTVFMLINNGDEFIGTLLLSSMIPVKYEFVTEIDINSVKDRPYKRLLSKEYRLILSNRDVIVYRAKTLYTKVVKNKNPFFISTCCDFEKLEQACDNYQLKNQN